MCIYVGDVICLLSAKVYSLICVDMVACEYTNIYIYIYIYILVLMKLCVCM